MRLYGGATADLDSLCASASEIAVGAEKACGAIEQKKAPKQERKRLAPPCGKGLDNVSLHLCQTRSFPICFPRPARVFAAFFGALVVINRPLDMSTSLDVAVPRWRLPVWRPPGALELVEPEKVLEHEAVRRIVALTHLSSLEVQSRQKCRAHQQDRATPPD